MFQKTCSLSAKIKDAKWPKTIQSDPSQRNYNLVSEFHNTHGHRTEDCHQVREEVARLLNEGHLREFLSDRAKNQFRERETTKKNEAKEPQHVIHMIMGGADAPQEPVVRRTKISIIREKRTRGYFPEDALTFSEEDTEALSQPHNDALVISFLINSFQIKCVLVDLGSSANIIRAKIIERLRLLEQIVPATRVLNGFNMARKTKKGEIILPVTVAGTTLDAKFYVIKGDMRYNDLFGRPWIHCMRAVPSTLHQVIKFPRKDGIKTVCGGQHAAREIFPMHDVVPALTFPPPNESTIRPGLDPGRT
ncbi:PREDICTED: uncharacterized protein LOC109211955 [Nicotiana attenuata]|uniref:uncharacterized protein LOC109211955 n=1 Tax=Nicotiana attenuata TaxID=49451 RepID=UPI0009045DFC|nr:PREDICTED: uncharacterized protein LOC109211955 [Nicotiana attenuata]